MASRGYGASDATIYICDHRRNMSGATTWDSHGEVARFASFEFIQFVRPSLVKGLAFIYAHAGNFFAHLIKHAHFGVANRSLAHF